jgi:phosphorylcholine metabolism protein LicD
MKNQLEEFKILDIYNMVQYIIIITIIIIIIILGIVVDRFLFNKNKENMTSKEKKLHRFTKCLSDMNSILNKNNQEFFLSNGTLLGQQKNNNFIEHDNNIYIGIFKDKFNISTIDRIKESKQFTFIRSYGKLEDSYKCTFVHCNGIPINIYLYYPMQQSGSYNYYYAVSFLGICDNKPKKFCKWGHTISGLSVVQFMNEEYKIPSNTDEYLTEIYGLDWKIPKYFSYVDGLGIGYKNMIN